MDRPWTISVMVPPYAHRSIRRTPQSGYDLLCCELCQCCEAVAKRHHHHSYMRVSFTWHTHTQIAVFLRAHARAECGRFCERCRVCVLASHVVLHNMAWHVTVRSSCAYDRFVGKVYGRRQTWGKYGYRRACSKSVVVTAFLAYHFHSVSVLLFFLFSSSCTIPSYFVLVLTCRLFRFGYFVSYAWWSRRLATPVFVCSHMMLSLFMVICHDVQVSTHCSRDRNYGSVWNETLAFCSCCDTKTCCVHASAGANVKIYECLRVFAYLHTHYWEYTYLLYYVCIYEWIKTHTWQWGGRVLCQ